MARVTYGDDALGSTDDSVQYKKEDQALCLTISLTFPTPQTGPPRALIQFDLEEGGVCCYDSCVTPVSCGERGPLWASSMRTWWMKQRVDNQIEQLLKWG